MWNFNLAVLVLAGALLLSIGTNALLYQKLAAFRRRKKRRALEGQAQKAAEEIYERMFPAEMLNLLKVKDYSDLKVGDQQYFSSVIMDVNMADLTGLVRNRKAEEVFASINRMLNQVIPLVYGHAGMVEEFQGAGFCALFLEGYEQALTAAVSICENINKLEGQDREYESVTAGLYYGPVMAGVVGHERRMTILTLSEAKEFADVLRAIGNRYDAKIVVTSSFLDQIENSAGKFNYRLLGCLLFEESGEIQKIYDVFDGDTLEIRNKKRKSKMVFEKGVDLFAKQKLPEARQHFIEVLKMAH